MYTREYRFKFYLNARHTIHADNRSSIHPHTWEIVTYIKRTADEFVAFSDIEKEIQEYLERYEGQLMNEIDPFTHIVPSMENMGEIIFGDLVGLSQNREWKLVRMEISENPSRSYIICEEGDGEAIRRNPAAPDLYRRITIDTVNKIENVRSADHPEEDQEPEKCDNSDGVQEVIEEKPQTDEKMDKGKTGSKGSFPAVLYRKPLLLNILILLLAAVGVFLWLRSTGVHPWGSDSWYHIFKSHFLYQEIQKGNWFPLYTGAWYNGIQPLRYWAPLPHYFLAALEFITGGNSLDAYNLFQGLVYFAGGLGWILWGVRVKRNGLGLSLGLLWFFLPDNLRVLFSEGNISRVAVNTLFPYLVLAVWTYMEKRSRKSLAAVSILMVVITLCHAMIAAMVGITVFLFVAWYGLKNKNLKEAAAVVTAAVLGIMLAGIWLYPALKGGIVSQNAEAVSALMKGLTYPMLESLNPVLRLKTPDMFYFGLPVFVIAVLGLIFGDKKSKAGFGMVLLIFFGTAREFVSVLVKIPMSQLFWMMRFTPLAMALFFVGLLLWKGVRKPLLVAFMVLLALDGMVSFKMLGHNAPVPEKLQSSLEQAVESATQRIALFDLSEFGSYPSYYFKYNGRREDLQQVYGSGWQGARTTDNIMWMDTALGKGWYSFVLDRSLEQGADTLVVKKSVLANQKEFLEKAEALGYKNIGETSMTITLQYPVNYTFGTIPSYEGLAIGKNAPNLVSMFPKFEKGSSDYLDDYSIEQLKNYKTVYLSGFKYRNKAKAEDLVQNLSQNGVQFLIDLTGAQLDSYETTPEFLGVKAQSVNFRQQMPVLDRSGEKRALGILPEEYSDWRTFYLVNLDQSTGTAEFENHLMDFLGTKGNDNIKFIGFNLPYYAVETGDEAALDILEQAVGMKTGEAPSRELVPLQVETDRNSITVKAAKPGVYTGIAALDTLRAVEGSYVQKHNMVQMTREQVTIQVGYPYWLTGLLISITGLLALIFFHMLLAYGLPWRREEEESFKVPELTGVLRESLGKKKEEAL